MWPSRALLLGLGRLGAGYQSDTATSQRTPNGTTQLLLMGVDQKMNVTVQGLFVVFPLLCFNKNSKPKLISPSVALSPKPSWSGS